MRPTLATQSIGASLASEIAPRFAMAHILKAYLLRLATTEKSEAKVYTERIWNQHSAKFSRLRDEQAAERQAEQGEQFTKTRGVSFALAKASLLNDNQHKPAPEQPSLEFRRGDGPAPLEGTFAKAAGKPGVLRRSVPSTGDQASDDRMAAT